MKGGDNMQNTDAKIVATPMSIQLSQSTKDCERILELEKLVAIKNIIINLK